MLAPLSDGTVLRRGDVLLIETGGGGGHGHPFDRPAAQVAQDIRDGFVSVEAARRDYGVVVRDGVLDAAATEALRAARPEAGAFHRREVRRCHRKVEIGVRRASDEVISPLPLREGVRGRGSRRDEPLPPTPSLKGRGSCLSTVGPSLSVAVDIGGTFTDITLADAATGRTWRAKVPSVPADPSQAFMAGVRAALAAAGATPAAIGRVLHGTTVATNLILEGKTARTALVTTAGFRHVMEIGRQDIPRSANLFSWVKPRRPVPPNASSR